MRSLIIAAVFACAGALHAEEGPVRVTADATRVVIAPGKTTTVRLKLDVEHPWHIYSTLAQVGPRGDGPAPTTVTINGAKGIDRVGPLRTSKPVTHFDPNFDMEVSTLEGSAWIELTLRADANVKTGEHAVKIVLSYQACDDQTCLPPQEQSLDLCVVVERTPTQT